MKMIENVYTIFRTQPVIVMSTGRTDEMKVDLKLELAYESGLRSDTICGN